MKKKIVETSSKGDWGEIKTEYIIKNNCQVYTLNEKKTILKATKRKYPEQKK